MKNSTNSINSFNSFASLEASSPCSEGLAFARKFRTVKQAWLACENPSWMFWFLGRFKPLTGAQAATLAWQFAERSLVNFEKEFPDDKRPRQAVEAARRCAESPTPENIAAAWSAESAAWSAAKSAAKSAAWSAAESAESAESAAKSAAKSAAWSAAESAESAESAAWSAESAAWSAARSAARSAAWSAESAARSAESKWQSDLIRKVVGNIFS